MSHLLLVLLVSGGEIAITIDDFAMVADDTAADAHDQRMLDALAEQSVKAEVFVTARHLERPHVADRLRGWSTAGHIIANHTYSHKSYHDMTLETFSGDILRAEKILATYSTFEKRFRFPMLKEGKTAATRDAMRTFLTQHGYTMGYVTVDTSDWYIDRRLRDRLAKDPKADTVRYRDYYLKHIADRVAYYDKLARETLGRPVKHTLLIHHNVLNALYLHDVLAMLEASGWTFVDANVAFADPVFSARPDVVPAGESIIWQLAKADGRIAKDLRYPAEDGDYEKAAMDALGL